MVQSIFSTSICRWCTMQPCPFIAGSAISGPFLEGFCSFSVFFKVWHHPQVPIAWNVCPTSCVPLPQMGYIKNKSYTILLRLVALIRRLPSYSHIKRHDTLAASGEWDWEKPIVTSVICQTILCNFFSLYGRMCNKTTAQCDRVIHSWFTFARGWSCSFVLVWQLFISIHLIRPWISGFSDSPLYVSPLTISFHSEWLIMYWAGYSRHLHGSRRVE